MPRRISRFGGTTFRRSFIVNMNSGMGTFWKDGILTDGPREGNPGGPFPYDPLDGRREASLVGLAQAGARREPRGYLPRGRARADGLGALRRWDRAVRDAL